MTGGPPRGAPAGEHRPVMLREVLDVIAPRDGGLYVDGTFGGGGYSQAMLEAADCVVWAIDRDPIALSIGHALAERFGGRLTLVPGRFGDMAELLTARGVNAVDGVVLDVGVSSFQLDEPGRGFSFRLDGPLDMRMEQDGQSAADVVNTLSETELADIIYRYGEERRSRRIASAIVARRRERPFDRTGDLADVVRRASGKPRHSGRETIDPATRTFQALRIYVNDEIGQLEQGMAAAERVLAPGGRLAVVTFHSLEDRAVKTFLRDASGGTPRRSRHLPDIGAKQAPTFRTITRQARRPAADEIAANPRARSARLRAAERTDALPQMSGGGAP